jgi:hypothetical protein
MSAANLLFQHAFVGPVADQGGNAGKPDAGAKEALKFARDEMSLSFHFNPKNKYVAYRTEGFMVAKSPESASWASAAERPSALPPLFEGAAKPPGRVVSQRNLLTRSHESA